MEVLCTVFKWADRQTALKYVLRNKWTSQSWIFQIETAVGKQKVKVCDFDGLLLVFALTFSSFCPLFVYSQAENLTPVGTVSVSFKVLQNAIN